MIALITLLGVLLIISVSAVPCANKVASISVPLPASKQIQIVSPLVPVSVADKPVASSADEFVVTLHASDSCSAALAGASLVVKQGGEIELSLPSTFSDLFVVDNATFCAFVSPTTPSYACPTTWIGCPGPQLPSSSSSTTAGATTQTAGTTSSAATGTTSSAATGTTSLAATTSTRSLPIAETETSSANVLSRTVAAVATSALASAAVNRNGLAAPLVFAALGGCGAVFAQQGPAVCQVSLRVELMLQSTVPTLTDCADFFSRPVATVVHGDDYTPITKSFTPGPKIACGRPFVSDSATVVSNASASTDDERAARWVSQGLGEHASVASFAAFSLQLMVNGAPFSLLTGAAKANADEVRHAEQSFALASRFAGHPITAEPFPRHAISSLVPQSLEELAEAAFREGCIAETLSVFAAARQVDENDVVDDEERAVLTGIVRDEARHSALAWRTVAWATATAKNAALNAKLMQIAVDESKRCAEHTCVVFERLIARLAAKVIGADDWQRVVESDDVDVEMDSLRTLTARTIEALIQTFE
jgi:hypothetical protein